MFGYTLFEIFIVLIIPIVYLSPVWISMFRDISNNHVYVCTALTIIAMLLPYPFWFIPILVSVMPKSVIEKLTP